MTKQQIMHSACIVGVMGGSLLSVWYTHQTLYAGRFIVLTLDEQIAPTLKPSLKAAVTTSLNTEYITDAPTLLATLKKEVPALAKVTMNYRIPGTVKINLSYERPLLVIKQINQAPSLLVDNGIYAPYQHYAPKMLSGLPALIIMEENFTEQHRRALYTWFTALPDQFFTRYNAQWHRPTEIIIRDTECPAFEYITTSATPWTPLLEQQCARLRATPPGSPKKYKKWIIDVRFKDQLIIRGVS